MGLELGLGLVVRVGVGVKVRVRVVRVGLRVRGGHVGLVLSVQPAALALGTLVPEVTQRDASHRRVTEGDPEELLELVGVPG